MITLQVKLDNVQFVLLDMLLMAQLLVLNVLNIIVKHVHMRHQELALNVDLDTF